MKYESKISEKMHQAKQELFNLRLGLYDAKDFAQQAGYFEIVEDIGAVLQLSEKMRERINALAKQQRDLGFEQLFEELKQIETAQQA